MEVHQQCERHAKTCSRVDRETVDSLLASERMDFLPGYKLRWLLFAGVVLGIVVEWILEGVR